MMRICWRRGCIPRLWDGARRMCLRLERLPVVLSTGCYDYDFQSRQLDGHTPPSAMLGLCRRCSEGASSSVFDRLGKSFNGHNECRIDRQEQQYLWHAIHNQVQAGRNSVPMDRIRLHTRSYQSDESSTTNFIGHSSAVTEHVSLYCEGS